MKTTFHVHLSNGRVLKVRCREFTVDRLKATGECTGWRAEGLAAFRHNPFSLSPADIVAVTSRRVPWR